MPKTHPDTEVNEQNTSSLDAEVFIPLDVDWRKTYYKNVIWRRVWAFVIDYFSTFIIATIPVLIIFPNADIEYDNKIFVFQISSFVLLCAIMESSKWRGTIGKRVMKIQITDDYGNSISFFRSLMRNLLRIVTGYSYAFIIPFIIQFFRYRKVKKLFHDELSHTLIGRRL